LHLLLEDQGTCITLSVRILVPVDRTKRKCFQFTAKCSRKCLVNVYKISVHVYDSCIPISHLPRRSTTAARPPTSPWRARTDHPRTASVRSSPVVHSIALGAARSVSRKISRRRRVSNVSRYCALRRCSGAPKGHLWQVVHTPSGIGNRSWGSSGYRKVTVGLASCWPCMRHRLQW